MKRDARCEEENTNDKEEEKEDRMRTVTRMKGMQTREEMGIKMKRRKIEWNGKLRKQKDEKEETVTRRK